MQVMTASNRYGFEDLPGLMSLMAGDEKHNHAAASTLDVLWVLYDWVLRVRPETLGSASASCPATVRSARRSAGIRTATSCPPPRSPAARSVWGCRCPQPPPSVCG